MIQVGTSGYSFTDWKGTVYPADLPESRMLSYYEQELGFDTVELNFTYYRLPSARTTAGMLKKVTPRFSFVARSHKDMTHTIWEDGSRKKTKDASEVFRLFGDGLAPIADAGRLTCVLLQFPSFFWPNKENESYLAACRELLPGIPLVVEFRNRAWLAGRAEATFSLLKESGLGYCVVDQPDLPRLMPFVPGQTSQIAYFRFHGRNKNWFTAEKGERYNYLYSEEELKGFLSAIRSVSSPQPSSKVRTLAFFNNCHGGAALKNALQLKEMLGLSAGSMQGKIF